MSGSRGWLGRVFAARSLPSTSMCFLHDKQLKGSVHSRLLLRPGRWCTDQKNASSQCCTDVHIKQQNFAWLVFSWISDRVLKATWLRNIRRDEGAGCFQVNPSTRVCGLHFLESDDHGGGRQRNQQTSRHNSFLN